MGNMDKTGQDLLNLLFNEGESICVSNNEFGFHSIPLAILPWSSNVILMSPNESVAASECHPSELILVAINPIKGYRRDSNVTAFRSFLIEMDMGTTDEQLGTIAHLKMPFSAQVFSGNKSVHTVITLDEDLKDEKDYRIVGNWIFNIVSQCDQNCKNPSRSVRIPGAIRPNTGKEQKLIKLNKRVSHKELFDWLNEYMHLRPIAKEKKIVAEGHAGFSRLSPWCRSMLVGMQFKLGRNQTWYAMAYDFAKAGFSEEDTIEELSKRFTEEHDFKEKELLTTVKSAFNSVRGKS